MAFGTRLHTFIKTDLTFRPFRPFRSFRSFRPFRSLRIGCDCSSRSQMVFAAFLIHPEGDVCVLPWDLLMKAARGAQRLPKDLNNRNSATNRLQLCLHNNSNYCKIDNFIFNFLLPLLSWAAQKPSRKNLSHTFGVWPYSSIFTFVCFSIYWLF